MGSLLFGSARSACKASQRLEAPPADPPKAPTRVLSSFPLGGLAANKLQRTGSVVQRPDDWRYHPFSLSLPDVAIVDRNHRDTRVEKLLRVDATGDGVFVAVVPCAAVDIKQKGRVIRRLLGLPEIQNLSFVRSVSDIRQGGRWQRIRWLPGAGFCGVVLSGSRDRRDQQGRESRPKKDSLPS